MECTPVREADGESKRTAMVLSRKEALELELMWVCMYACICVCV